MTSPVLHQHHLPHSRRRWPTALLFGVVLTSSVLGPVNGHAMETTEAGLSNPSGVQKILAGSVERLLRHSTERYLHHNHLGSHVLSTNLSGQLQGKQRFSLFGAPRSRTRFIDHRGFSGQELDNSTGLYHFTHRYLDPIAGRWTRPDPLFTTATANRLAPGQATTAYAYVANNPVNIIDPTGLAGTPVARQSSTLQNKGHWRKTKQKQLLGSSQRGLRGEVSGETRSRGLGGGAHLNATLEAGGTDTNLFAEGDATAQAQIYADRGTGEGRLALGLDASAKVGTSIALGESTNLKLKAGLGLGAAYSMARERSPSRRHMVHTLEVELGLGLDIDLELEYRTPISSSPSSNASSPRPPPARPAPGMLSSMGSWLSSWF